MRFSQKTRQPAGQHALDALLGRCQKTGAEKSGHVRIDFAQAPKGFFAIHERHGKIEQDKVEPVRLFPETLQAFEARLDRGHFKPGFGKNSFSQNAGRRLIINDEDAARPSGMGPARSFGSVGFSG